MAPQLHYLIGDATDPIYKPAIITHVCNSVGAWGAGFVIALSRKNKDPEKAYRRWYYENKESFVLGAIQLIPFSEDVMVANMIAQKGIQWEGKIPPIRYDALEQCLSSVYKYAKGYGYTVAMPRIGADLAGGSWGRVEAIIKKTMTVDTYVYTLESQKDKWPTLYENIDNLKTVQQTTPEEYIPDFDIPIDDTNDTDNGNLEQFFK